MLACKSLLHFVCLQDQKLRTLGGLMQADTVPCTYLMHLCKSQAVLMLSLSFYETYKKNDLEVPQRSFTDKLMQM